MVIMAVLAMSAGHMTVVSIVAATKATISAVLAGMTNRALHFKLDLFLLTPVPK